MKKNILIVVGIVALVALLAGGAFTAVRLLASARAPETTAAGGGVRVMESIAQNGDGAPIAVRTTILPAPELPDEPAAAAGILVSRKDNALVVGTGAIELNVDIQVDAATGQERASVVPSASGPELEVVVGRDTRIYRDTTDLTAETPTESGEREVQQAVQRVDSIEEMGDQAELQVWGERSGDRIVADVLVFGPLAGGAFE